MRVRDGPAAVRGVAPPPRSHWRKPGRRRGREPRVRRPVVLLHNPDPLEEGRIQVLRSLLVLAGAAVAALALTVAGASGAAGAPTAFPVTVVGSNGKVTVTKRPSRIVSLSPTATETLFAIGAGPQVVAVDDQSDFPKSAPKTALSGFTPNVEAIAAYRPDLVVIAYDPKGLSEALGRLGITVLHQDGAKSFKGAYQQIRQLGKVTGRDGRAAKLVAGMKTKIGAIVADAKKGKAGPLRLPRARSDALLGDVEDVHRSGLYGARPREHRRRRRLGRVRLPAALRRVRRLVEPRHHRARRHGLLRAEGVHGRGASRLGPDQRRFARAPSYASTTRSRRAGGRGWSTSSAPCRRRSLAFASSA